MSKSKTSVGPKSIADFHADARYQGDLSRADLAYAIHALGRGDDLLELAAPAPLDAGAWTIAIDYTGAYDVTNTTGVFKQTVGGAPYVFSQFEAVYARRAFPCFDEPDNKVPWQLTLDVPAGLVAAGNAPIAAEHPLPDGLRRVERGTRKTAAGQ